MEGETMSKVCLIRPRASLPSSLGKVVPLGIAYLAAVARSNGHEVELLDLYDLTKDEAYLSLSRAKSDVYGISFLSEDRLEAKEICHTIRKLFPNSFVVIGGPHATFMDNHVHSYLADACIRGEGEESFLNLLENIKLGRSIFEIPGVSWSVEEDILRCPDRKQIEDLDTLPFPAIDMFDLTKYNYIKNYMSSWGIPSELRKEKDNAVNLITSRGCLSHCKFCSSRGFWNGKFRAHSAKRVLDEIEWLYKEFNVKHVSFWDDIFTFNRERTYAICEGIIRRNLHLSWNCMTRLDLIDRDLLVKMTESGCTMISFGVESGSPKILSKIKKGLSVENATKQLKLIKEFPIKIRTSIMVGNPGENIKTIEETIDFLSFIQPDVWSINIAKIYPGSEFHREAVANGWDANACWLSSQSPPNLNTEIPSHVLEDYTTQIHRHLAAKAILKAIEE